MGIYKNEIKASWEQDDIPESFKYDTVDPFAEAIKKLDEAQSPKYNNRFGYYFGDIEDLEKLENNN